ncbi:MAG: hypothetical protein PHU44_13060 [Syntrophales bacterium]|nr:hypothetical protein [Syntrophales bacterium]MDD5642810.1 hypothetical protein [Syntrophales bacterium]
MAEAITSQQETGEGRRRESLAISLEVMHFLKKQFAGMTTKEVILL